MDSIYRKSIEIYSTVIGKLSQHKTRYTILGLLGIALGAIASKLYDMSEKHKQIGFKQKVQFQDGIINFQEETIKSQQKTIEDNKANLVVNDNVKLKTTELANLKRTNSELSYHLEDTQRELEEVTSRFFSSSRPSQIENIRTQIKDIQKSFKETLAQKDEKILMLRKRLKESTTQPPATAWEGMDLKASHMNTAKKQKKEIMRLSMEGLSIGQSHAASMAKISEYCHSSEQLQIEIKGIVDDISEMDEKIANLESQINTLQPKPSHEYIKA